MEHLLKALFIHPCSWQCSEVEAGNRYRQKKSSYKYLRKVLPPAVQLTLPTAETFKQLYWRKTRLDTGVERALQSNTDGATSIFTRGGGEKLTDYGRQSALTDCKNKMAISFLFRMHNIFAWHKRTVWSHPYQAVTDKYSVCLLLNTLSQQLMCTQLLRPYKWGERAIKAD